MSTLKYVPLLTDEDIKQIMVNCFHYSENNIVIDRSFLDSSDMPGLRVYRNNTCEPAVFLYDTYIHHRKRECIVMNVKKTTVNDFYIKFLYEKFGEAVLDDRAEYVLQIDEKLKAYQNALAKKESMKRKILEEIENFEEYEK